MKRSLIASLFLSAAAWLAAGPATSAEPISRYANMGACREIDGSSKADLEEGHDFVLYRCVGLPGWPVWQVFLEGTTSRVGFGRRRNLSGMFGPDAGGKTPLEWRGFMKGGIFEPFAVILRSGSSPDPNDHRTTLVVYRLRPDGTSCIIGEEIATNTQARQIADASLTRYTCLEEPDLL